MKVIRILLLILVLVIVVVAVGGFVVYEDTMRGPLPQTSGALTVEGLHAQVEVLRDDWGIPHIYGSDLHDLFFAQGYVQAQDRWWQMEFYRHIGSGTIGELTGKNNSAFGNDVYIRTAGWRRIAEQEVRKLTDDALAALTAFADGVNAYVLNRSTDDLAMQYRLLGVTGVNIMVEPWTIVDTLVWGKVMAYNLTDSGDYESTRNQIIGVLGREMMQEFTPPWPYDGDRPTILYAEDLPVTDASASAQTAFVAPDYTPVSATLAGGIRPGEFAFRGETGIGSNNWVATGSMTAGGTPLLANDPHLGIQMPSIWYEIGLHCLPVTDHCPLNVVGFAFPPAPGVIVGHNDDVAWGVTNVGADVLDLYRIKVNPDDPLQYEWNGEWRDMTLVSETINFGDGEAPVTIQVRQTHIGPVINDSQIDEQTGEVQGFNTDDPMVQRWTAGEPGTLYNALVELDTASNWEEFRAALRDWDVPSQNFVYADVHGNIGYQTPGNMPIRPLGMDGLTPTIVSSDAEDWQGYVPFDDLPRIFNPPRDYIVTANQAIVPMQYYDQLAEKLGADANYLFSYDWAYGERAQRITELLKENAPNTIESYQRIQSDNRNMNAPLIAPYLADLQIDPGSVAEARDFLLTWDFSMDADSAGAALFAEFNARLLHNLFDDQLPEDIEADNHELWSATRLLLQPDSLWWDDAATSDVIETRDDILLRSFSDAVNATTAALGNNPAEWTWGKLHTATFVSNPLGVSGIDLIEQLVNRGPVAVSGGSDSVNATGWSPASGKFTVGSLPSMRMIVDVADFDNSLTVHTTGQSGHPASPHYDDMIDPWRLFRYHPMLWSRASVEAAAADRLILNPAVSG